MRVTVEIPGLPPIGAGLAQDGVRCIDFLPSILTLRLQKRILHVVLHDQLKRLFDSSAPGLLEGTDLSH